MEKLTPGKLSYEINKEIAFLKVLADMEESAPIRVIIEKRITELETEFENFLA